MSRTLTPVTDAHTAFRDAICELLKLHGEHLSAIEMLALASHVVGQLLALQDQSAITAGEAIEVVKANIELGNRAQIGDLEDMPVAGHG